MATVSRVTPTTAPLPSFSASSSPSPPPQRVKPRRRPQTPPSDSASERVIGHVLASRKFKCSDPKCAGLRFGRQADFKRHHENTHSTKKFEYFCTEEGCERSRRPAKKGKGRGFGMRRDKMEEHVQTVHFKASRKRKRDASESKDEEDENEAEEADEAIANTRKHL